MKRNFKTVLTGLGGVELTINTGTKDSPVNTPMTLKDVSISALLGIYENERPDATQKLKRQKLAMAIHDNDDLELAAEDIVLLKTLIDKCFASPLVVGSAYSILDADYGEAAK